MKIFELINVLNSEEKKWIKKSFQSSNSQVQKLFIEIIQSDEQSFILKKHIIYRKIYNKAWSESQEKHFKNQLSVLYDDLRAFIAQEWIYQKKEIFEINKYSNYLHELSKRLNVELFEKEWNYYFQLFESKQHYYGLGELYFTRFRHIIRNPKNIKEALNCINESFRYKLMAYWEDIAGVKYTAFTLNYAKDIYGMGNLILDKDFDDLKAKTETDFFNPIEIASRLLNETSEEKKWELVKETFYILSNPKYFIKSHVKFKVCQGIYNYAILLIYQEELEKSKQIFDFILSNDLLKSAVTNPYIFYFNFSTLLLKQGEHEKSMMYHLEVMNNLEGIHDSKKSLFIIRNIYLNLLNKKFDNVFDDINDITPQLFKEDQQLYVRILLIIYLIETDDLDSAIRECENAKKSVSYNSELAEEESTILDYIHKLLLVQSKEKIEKSKYLKLKQTIEESNLWISSSHLLKLWIKKYIENLDLVIV